MNFVNAICVAIVSLTCLAALEGSAKRCEEDDKETWSYNGRTNGPTAWGKTFKDCNGRSQSPINIVTNAVEEDPNLKPLEMVNYDKPVLKAEIINSGITAIITPKDKVDRTISINGDTYNLTELLFCWGRNDARGSEHLINGKAYALEAHFIHRNGAGKEAIVGVLYEADHANNTGFEPISEELPHIRFKNEKTELRSHINLTKLLPRLPLSFFLYPGSLTTPPCTEGVTRSLARDTARIGTNQIKELRRLYSVTREDDHAGCHIKDNLRSVQPLYGRTVTAST